MKQRWLNRGSNWVICLHRVGAPDCVRHVPRATSRWEATHGLSPSCPGSGGGVTSLVLPSRRVCSYVGLANALFLEYHHRALAHDEEFLFSCTGVCNHSQFGLSEGRLQYLKNDVAGDSASSTQDIAIETLCNPEHPLVLERAELS
ncbi:hypothetical protein BaRGS_00013281 [Batillaria attramentaria]|uniref:Uncharacterized protein n=1 Tax=Batillaria attramentaria TaxID=370345 RepID=A0ABD0L8S3_9CAEN